MFHRRRTNLARRSIEAGQSAPRRLNIRSEFSDRPHYFLGHDRLRESRKVLKIFGEHRDAVLAGEEQERGSARRQVLSYGKTPFAGGIDVKLRAIKRYALDPCERLFHRRRRPYDLAAKNRQMVGELQGSRRPSPGRKDTIWRKRKILAGRQRTSHRHQAEAMQRPHPRRAERTPSSGCRGGFLATCPERRTR